MRNLFLIIGTLFIVLNTLTGLIVSAYNPINYLLADLSIALSTGIAYYLACSKMNHGFKIGLVMLFFFTGIIRFICIVIMSPVLENNILLLVAIGLFILELLMIATALIVDKRKVNKI